MQSKNCAAQLKLTVKPVLLSVHKHGFTESIGSSGQHKSGEDHECLSIAWPGVTLDVRNVDNSTEWHSIVAKSNVMCGSLGYFSTGAASAAQRPGCIKTGSLGRWARAGLNGPVLQSLRWDSCSRGTNWELTHSNLMGTHNNDKTHALHGD